MKQPVPGIHPAAICTADVDRSMKLWRDGLELTELFDHTFTGDWPELFGAKTDRRRSIFLGHPQTPDSGIIALVAFEGGDAASDSPQRPRHGFFLLSLQREVDETRACKHPGERRGTGCHADTDAGETGATPGLGGGPVRADGVRPPR
jgi:hypothetical protein